MNSPEHHDKNARYAQNNPRHAPSVYRIFQENGGESEDEYIAGLVQGSGDGCFGEFHPRQPQNHCEIGSHKRTG